MSPKPLITTFRSASPLPASPSRTQTRDRVFRHVPGSDSRGSCRGPQNGVPAAAPSSPPTPSHPPHQATSLLPHTGAAAPRQPPRPLSLLTCSSNDRKADPSPLLLPQKQGSKRAGRRRARNAGLVPGLQTNRASARDFRAKREEELSCDNKSTTAKFSRLFLEIQMLGKYNLIISCRGKSSAASPVLLSSLISPHPGAEAHAGNTAMSPRPGCADGSRQLGPQPSALRRGRRLRTSAERAPRPGAVIGRRLFGGRRSRARGWGASLSSPLRPEQHVGSDGQRGSGGLGSPWKPGPGWDSSVGRLGAAQRAPCPEGAGRSPSPRVLPLKRCLQAGG